MTSNYSENDAPFKTSPLDSKQIITRGPANADITLKEEKDVGKLILRGSLSDKKFITPIKKYLSEQFPALPNVFFDDAKVRVVWLGPDEWLLLTNWNEIDTLTADLTKALSKTYFALVDVSDNSTIIELKGKQSLEILMKGCSLDVHPKVFQPGCSVQTDLGLANIILLKIAEDPVFQIVVRASFANYLWDWLLDAADEFKLRIET